MPNDSKVLVPYNVLNTSSDQVTPLLYAGSGLTSIETNRASAQRMDKSQAPLLEAMDKQAAPASKERLITTLKAGDDHLELVWQAWQDKYEQAKTFIEQGYNEKDIDIQRDLITELKQAKDEIIKIPAELSSPVDAMISDANSKSKGWIDELAESDRANAYQLARHIDGSLKAVTEALKAFKHDQNLDLDSWKERVSAGYKQKHGLTQDTDNLRRHMTLRRHAVRNRLQDVRHELESSKNKIQRKGWRNTFKREAEVKAYFEQVINALEVVINHLKGKQKQFDPSFKDSAASLFVSKAGQSKEEKRQRGEHEQDKESNNINLADLEVAMGEQILKFEHAAVKAGKATKSTVAKMGDGAKNKMAKVAMQVARTPTYVAPTALHLLHKARSPMAKGVNKALNHNLSDEDQIIRSIVRSLCWSLIQPAFRMQYDYAPLLGAAQSLAKSKHSNADSADVLETVTEGSAVTSGINKAVSAQSEEVSGEAEKSRQEALEPSLKKAQQASESLLAQVSLGGNGALREVLNHYPLSDLAKLSEQLQSLSLSEETPETKIHPSLGKDVQTLKSLLAQAPSNRDAVLNQVSDSERRRLVNILATIKDMGLSEQRFKDTVAYFLGIGQEVLSEQGQESLGKIVVKIEDALRKGEAYQKLRVQALRLRARATKASDYQDSSLDSIIHKARFAGLVARDAYDELDSLALKHM